MSKETIRRAPAISQLPASAHRATFPPPYTPGTFVNLIILALCTGPPDPDAPGIVATLFAARLAGRGDV
jgi:hypothetical protein